jgi:hypothetical protein
VENPLRRKISTAALKNGELTTCDPAPLTGGTIQVMD